MEDVYIIDCKRSAVAKYGSQLALTSATEIASQVIQGLLASFGKLKGKIDKVIIGNVLSAGLGQNPARIAAYNAGLSNRIPALTVNQVCSSGLQSIVIGAQFIQTGEADLILAGGMENMSRCPYYLLNYRQGVKFGHQTTQDGMIKDGLWCSLTDQHMGLLSEKLVKKYKISRFQQDRYALNSHKKAIKAIKLNKFKQEIVPLKILKNNQKSVFKEDEQPRKDTSLKKLKKLKPVFKKRGTITAGNASPLSDGASVVLLASGRFVRKNKIKPQVQIKSYATVGLNPNYFGLGVTKAITKCLKKTSLKLRQIDLWEINEAFACQVLASLKLIKIEPQLVNVNGGAIALGHPIGASGSRILTTLVHEMKKRKIKKGLASLCTGGGIGTAIIIENI